MSRNTNNISNIIQCPICQCTMKNATILYPTGQTYCFECIFECLEIYPNKDPITNTTYDETDLIPNYTVRSMIENLDDSKNKQSLEENKETVVEAKIVGSSNIRDCKFGKKCKRKGCWFNHPEGQSLYLTIV